MCEHSVVIVMCGSDQWMHGTLEYILNCMVLFNCESLLTNNSCKTVLLLIDILLISNRV